MPAPKQQPAWNTKAIRELLSAAFSAEELRTICYDYFRPVYEDLAGGMTKGQAIQQLVEYCERRGQLSDLLQVVRTLNPHQYANFAAELQTAVAEPPPPAARGQTIPGGAADEPVEIRRRYALLVGVRDYFDANYRPLPHTVHDVVQLGEVLSRYGYTVRALHSDQTDPALRPTRENIWGEFENLARQTGPGDLLLIHFGGHGDLDNNSVAYLVPENGRKPSLARTAIGLDEFKQALANAGAQAKIMILDACHSGIGRDAAGMDAEFERQVYREAAGTATLAACRHAEVAYEHDTTPHGVFTYYMLEGLQGQAARPGKNFVTFNDLNEYVTNAVKKWAIQHGRQQWPNASAQLVGSPLLVEFS